MHTALFDVLDFHKKMGLAIGDPTNPDLTVDTRLRWELIKEEFDELTLALEGKDKNGDPLSDEDQVVAVADALGDIAYVVAGAAASWGIDLGAVFDAIHASNMTKTPGNKRADGKILKGENYKPPKIKQALKAASLEGPWELDEDVEDPDSWMAQMAKAAAKPHKTKKAMQELKIAPSFVECECPHGDVREPDHDPECSARDYPIERDTEPTIPYNGQFLARGAFLFECDCGRTQEANRKQGSRGGISKTAHVECMCGKVFDITFSMHNGEEHAEFQVEDLSVTRA